MSQTEGKLIIFDGPSGTGKGTLIKSVIPALESRNLKPFIFIEEQEDHNRQEILEARTRGRANKGTGDREMAEVLVEHRVALYRQIVTPALLNGDFVLGDRGEPATLAYQTEKGELTMDEVWYMHRVKGVMIPDRVVLTLCNAKTSLEREELDKRIGSRRQVEFGKGLSGKVSSDPDASWDEKLQKRGAILSQYQVAAEFLRNKGVPVLPLDTEQMTVPEEVTSVIGFLGLG